MKKPKSVIDKFGHHNNWKYCPGCGKTWELDSESFGCWSCGFIRQTDNIDNNGT